MLLYLILISLMLLWSLEIHFELIEQLINTKNTMDNKAQKVINPQFIWN